MLTVAVLRGATRSLIVAFLPGKNRIVRYTLRFASNLCAPHTQQLGETWNRIKSPLSVTLVAAYYLAY
jgi:hypothetical protein